MKGCKRMAGSRPLWPGEGSASTLNRPDGKPVQPPMTRASPWQSVQFKLPALMGALLVLVGGGLTFLYHRSLEQTLIGAAQVRLERAARALGDALRPTFDQRMSTVGRLAARPELAGLLADPEGGRAAAEPVIREAFPTGGAGSTIELRDATGG